MNFNYSVLILFLLLSHVQLFVTPWTVACQVPLSMDKNTKVGCHSLLQGILPSLGIESRSPALQVDSSLSHQESLY